MQALTESKKGLILSGRGEPSQEESAENFFDQQPTVQIFGGSALRAVNAISKMNSTKNDSKKNIEGQKPEAIKLAEKEESESR